MSGREQPPWVLVTVVPYTLLAVVVAYKLIASDGVPLLDLGLAGLAAVWVLVMFTLRPGGWDQPVLMGVFFAGLVVITAIMVLRDPAFALFTPAAYIYAFTVLPWPWRLLGVAVVAVIAGSAQASNVGTATVLDLVTSVIVVVFNVVIMGVTAWVLRHNELQRAELSRTNRLLEATLAENAGLHQQLLAQAREAGVLDERQRMAREIHDTLAQGLTGIITQLHAAEQIHPVPAQWDRPFEAVKKLARDSLAEARRSVDALRPEPLETAQLSDALADIADHWSKLHGLAVQVTTTGTVRPMTPETEFALLRTAQEALANVAKHAQATRAGVTLSYLEHEVALDVRDDGQGFDPLAATGGFGLGIMRQRVEGLAGVLTIESEPGGGTGISACVPRPCLDVPSAIAGPDAAPDATAETPKDNQYSRHSGGDARNHPDPRSHRTGTSRHGLGAADDPAADRG